MESDHLEDDREIFKNGHQKTMQSIGIDVSIVTLPHLCGASGGWRAFNRIMFWFGLVSTGETNMQKHKVFAMKFSSIYPLYIQKAERKNRTKEEVDQIICWLTGYTEEGLNLQIEQGHDLETFFAQAPAMNPNRSQIKGVVCGVRVEEIEDPLMQKIRYLDKLIDELAHGRVMAKILRDSGSQ